MRKVIVPLLVACLLLGAVSVFFASPLSQAGVFFRQKLGDSAGSFRIVFPSEGPTKAGGPSVTPSIPRTGLDVPLGGGSDDVSVLEVQMLLWLGGYRFDDSLGEFGSGTKQALRRLQRDCGLPLTGVPDDATVQALYRAVIEKLARKVEPSLVRPPEIIEPPPGTPPATPSNPVEAPEDRDSSPPGAVEPRDGLTKLESRMVELLNRERANSGLKPLGVDMRLVELARKKSRDMIQNEYFFHQSPTYGSPFDMMRVAGIEYRYAGENIAGAPTVEAAHEALMNSEGHRRNILSPNFKKVGIGIVEGGPYGLMATQMFTG